MWQPRKRKTGLPPGSVIFTGNKKVEKIQIHYLQYNQDHFEDNALDNHSEIIVQESAEHIVDWYDIRGLHDDKLIEQLGKTFKIHSLVLEDVVDTEQRPKYEEF
ncbi:MAG: hypothetical protein AAF960_17345 [Bacteroidota bacterium]